MRSKIFLISILVLFIAVVLLYINRSHLGYFEYLFAKFNHKEIELLENRLIETLNTNPDILFETFDSELGKFSKNKNICHGVAHKLGHESFEIYGFEKSMQIAKPLCGAGFIHGLIESRFGSFANKDELSEITDICEEKDESCNHGMGHGLMVLTNNNLEESLLFCDSLKPLAQSDCYDGVFMHVFDNEETGISKDIPERLEKEKLCKIVDKKYQKSCVFYLPRLFVEEKEIALLSKEICDNFTEDNYITCLVGSGTMFGKYLYTDYKKSKKLCEVFGDDMKFCLEGVDLYRNTVF